MIKIERHVMLAGEIPSALTHDPTEPIYFYKSIDTETGKYLEVIVRKTDVDNNKNADEEIRKHIMRAYKKDNK
jgi:hypothetical protein